ncbi:MAG: hypothetical protein Q8R79_03955 [Legionellaceae bacterium]|nr:hypothetical protein [Legionellaceae bacterium]
MLELSAIIATSFSETGKFFLLESTSLDKLPDPPQKIDLKVHLKIPDKPLQSLYKKASKLSPKSSPSKPSSKTSSQNNFTPNLEPLLETLGKIQNQLHSLTFVLDLNHPTPNDASSKSIDYRQIHQDLCLPLLDALQQELLRVAALPRYTSIFTKRFVDIKILEGSSIDNAWLIQHAEPVDLLLSSANTALSHYRQPLETPSFATTPAEVSTSLTYPELALFFNTYWNASQKLPTGKSETVCTQSTNIDTNTEVETQHELNTEVPKTTQPYYIPSVKKQKTLSFDKLLTLIEENIIKAAQSPEASTTTTFPSAKMHLYLQWLQDHCFTPIQGYSHPDYTWIPGVAENNTLALESIPYGGAANQAGKFYTNFWESPYQRLELHGDHASIHRYSPTLASSNDPFASVANIPCYSSTEPTATLTDLADLVSQISDAHHYYPSLHHSQTTWNPQNTLNQAINQHLAPYHSSPFSPITPSAFENIYVSFQSAGIHQFFRIFPNDLSLDLRTQLWQRYFSKFEQLDYFIQDLSFQKTSEAIKTIQGWGIIRQRLFFKFLENIGLSRQPLDKIVTTYTVLCQKLAELGVDEALLLKKNWHPAKSGYGPIEFMGAMHYVLRLAKTHDCLEEQIACLDDLVFSRLNLIPLFMHDAKILCKEICINAPDPSTLLTKTKTFDHKKLSFPPAPKHFTFQNLSDFDDLNARMPTSDPSLEMHQFFVSTPARALSVKSFHAFYTQQYALSVSAPPAKKTLQFRQYFSLFIMLIHRLHQRISTPDCQKILDLIRKSSIIHTTEIANYLLTHPEIKFSHASELGSFLQSFNVLTSSKQTKAVKANTDFWLRFWQQHNLAARTFYASCMVDNPKLFDLQFAALQQLDLHKDGSFTPYAQVLFIALCQDIANFSSLKNKLFNLQHPLKVQCLLQAIVHEHHYFYCDTLNTFLDSSEQNPQKLEQLLRSNLSNSATIDLDLCTTHGEGLQKTLQTICEKNGLTQKSPAQSAEYVLLSCSLPSEDRQALTTAFYEEVFQDLSNSEFKTCIVKIYTQYALQEKTLKNTQQCMPIIPLYQNIPNTAYFQNNSTEIQNLLFAVSKIHPLETLEKLLTLVSALHRAYLPLFSQIFKSTYSSQKQTLLLQYCLTLAQKGLPLSLIQEVVSTRLATMDAAALSNALTFMNALGDFFTTHKNHPAFPTLIRQTALIKADKHAILFTLLSGPPSDTLAHFLELIPAENFNDIIQIFADALTSDNAERISQIFEWYMRSYIASQASQASEPYPMNASIYSGISTFIDTLLQHETLFTETSTLFASTTPTLSRLEATLFTGEIDSLSALIHDPRGDRAVSERPLEDKSTRSKNITRLFKELGAISASTAPSASINTHQLSVELDYFIHATESSYGIYQGKGPSELSPQELKTTLETLRNTPNLSFSEKARVALPLIQEALFYATGKTLNDTQRLALVQAAFAPQRLLFQNIATGEGKSLTDMCKCALLWAAGGGAVQYTTSTLVDAQRDFDEFKGFFKVLGIPTSNGTLHSRSDATAFQKHGVNFSTLEELALWRFQHDPGTRHIRSVINESDSAFLDARARTPLRLAVPELILRENPWIYAGINAYLQKNHEKLKEDIQQDILNNGIQHFLLQHFQTETTKIEVLDHLSPQQYHALFQDAYFADRLKEKIDYQIIEDDTGKRHVHPIKDHFAADNQNTHFMGYIHGCLCAKINSDPPRIKNGTTVEIPPKTNSHAEGSITGLVLADLHADPENIVYCSSGTVAETAEERQRLAIDLTPHAAFVHIPRHQTLHRIDHDADHPRVLPHETAHFKTILEQIAEIQTKHPGRPIVICLKDTLSSEHFYQQCIEHSYPKSQCFSGNPHDAKHFVHQAGSVGMISVISPALLRNMHIKKQKKYGLAVICAAVLSPRNKEQLFGRTAREDAEGDTYEIVTQADLEAYTTQHPASDLHAWDPEKHPLEFMTSLSLSIPWIQNVPAEIKESFIAKAQAFYTQKEAFFEYLQHHNPFLKEEEQQTYDALVDAYIQKYAIKTEVVPSFNKLLETHIPADLHTVPSLLRTQYANPALSFLHASEEKTVSLPSDFIQRWLSDESHAQADWISAWFSSSQKAAQTALCQALIDELDNTEDGYTQLLQNPRFYTLLKELPSVSPALKSALLEPLNAEAQKNGFSPSLKTVLENIQQQLSGSWEIEKEPSFNEALETYQLSAPSLTTAAELPPTTAAASTETENAVNMIKALLKKSKLAFEKLILNESFTSLLAHPAAKEAFKAHLIKQISKQGANPNLLKALSILQKAPTYKNISLIDKEFIMASFAQYKKNFWRIDKTRQKVMREIEDTLKSPDFDGDYFKLIHEQARNILQQDIHANQGLFFKKHFLNKSRFISMLQSWLPIVASTTQQTLSGLTPFSPENPLKKIGFFDRGLDKVIHSYNKEIEDIKPQNMP